MKRPKQVTQTWIYPINLQRLANIVKNKGYDFAPHALQWSLCAKEIANVLGEDGREIFHTIASVWPDYDFKDSDHCFTRALRKRDETEKECGYIRHACRKFKINLDNPALRCGKPFLKKNYRKEVKKHKTMQVDISYFVRTLTEGKVLSGANYLTDLLLNLYPNEDVRRVINEYCVGFDAMLYRGVAMPIIFWYIDDDMNLMNAKKIQYKVDGHRDKNIAPRIMYPSNPICLYGLHLIDKNEKVAIVESEKSCLIMSLEMPEYTWMAVGGLNFFNEDMLRPLKNKTIVAFPDLDPEIDKQTHTSISHSTWKKTARKLGMKGYNISVSDFLEENCSSLERLNKYDVADFFLNDRIKRFQKNSLWETK